MSPDENNIYLESEELDPLAKGPSPLVFTTSLASDAIYFNAARRALAQARALKPAVDAAHLRWSQLQARARAADQLDVDGEQAHLGYALEEEEPRIAQAYGPYIEALAVTQVMAASALEAHINDQASARLARRAFENFDKLPLEGKWLFLPRLVPEDQRSGSGFDPGAEPFQGFAKVVKARNDLVHFKTKREEWVAGEAPASLSKLGLTLDAAERSLVAAEAMIRRLAEVFSSRAPYWLNTADYMAFDWGIEGLDMSDDI